MTSLFDGRLCVEPSAVTKAINTFELDNTWHQLLGFKGSPDLHSVKLYPVI